MRMEHWASEGRFKTFILKGEGIARQTNCPDLAANRFAETPTVIHAMCKY